MEELERVWSQLSLLGRIEKHEVGSSMIVQATPDLRGAAPIELLVADEIVISQLTVADAVSFEYPAYDDAQTDAVRLVNAVVAGGCAIVRHRLREYFAAGKWEPLAEDDSTNWAVQRSWSPWSEEAQADDDTGVLVRVK